MSLPLSGVTPNTKGGFVTGPGVVYKNYDLEIPRDDETQPGVPLGATRGGVTFNSNIVTRQIPVDGLMDPVKCFNKRAPGAGPQLTVRLLELTQETLKLSLPGAVITENGGVTAGEISDESYIDNITFICSTTDPNGKYFYIVIRNALATAVSPMSFPDNDEGVLEVTFTGHRLITDLATEPFEFITADANPEEEGDG